jgi:hypothetical protein
VIPARSPIQPRPAAPPMIPAQPPIQPRPAAPPIPIPPAPKITSNLTQTQNQTASKIYIL